MAIDFWRGETKPIHVDLTDGETPPVALDITGWEEFKLAIGVGVDAVAVKEWAVVAPSTGNITVVESPPSLTVELSQAESNALAVTPHKLDAWIKIGGDWIHCVTLRDFNVSEPVVAVPSV